MRLSHPKIHPASTQQTNTSSYSKSSSLPPHLNPTTSSNLVFAMENVTVLIVGAGPAGLAMAACLTQFSIPYVIVEREDCSASLWRNRAYDRLKLHLAKEFCELPHMPYPADAPTYIPKALFVKYLDDYIGRFNIQPKYLTSVESSTYDNDKKCWSIVARDMA